MFLHRRPPREETEFDAIVEHRESPARKFNRTAIHTADRIAVPRFAIGQVSVCLDRFAHHRQAVFDRNRSSSYDAIGNPQRERSHSNVNRTPLSSTDQLRRRLDDPRDERLQGGSFASWRSELRPKRIIALRHRPSAAMRVAFHRSWHA
jgi:hypothetical protein